MVRNLTARFPAEAGIQPPAESPGPGRRRGTGGAERLEIFLSAQK
jgi:hypothetical protein